MRLSLLGLDGLPPWLLELAASKLRLPNLSQALSSGRLLELYSMPPITPVAWTTIAAGVGPAKHGVWGFTKYYRDERGSHRSRPYTAADVMYPRLFEDAAIMGLESIVVNYPLTWPLRSLCCLERMTVVGDTFLAPRVEYWPPELEGRLSRYFPPFSEEAGARYERSRLIAEGAAELVDAADADLAAVVVPFPDQPFHADPWEVLSVGERSEAVWRAVDELAGRLMRRSRTFVLVSDHGVGVHTTCVNVLAPLMRATGVGVPASLRGRLLLRLASAADSLSLLLPPRLSPRAAARSGRLGWLRRLFESGVAAIARPGAAEGGESELASQPFTYDAGGLSISRVIYFRDEAERERGLRAILSDRASRYLRVRRLEEAFRGAYLPQYPALFVESVDERRYHPVSSRSLASLRRDLMPDHDVVGTLLVYGEAAGSVSAGQARVEDVAVTALHAMGLPAPRGADGSSLLGEPPGYYAYDAAARLRRAMAARRQAA